MAFIINLDEVRIEKLSKIHKLDSFDCGDEDINEFLKQDALKWQEKKLAVTLIFIFKEEIIGFFCCSGDSIRLRTFEKEDEDVDYKPIPEFPAIKIGRIGRDKRHRDQGLGEKILKYAIGYAQELSEKAGIRFITVDAYPNKVEWYGGLGFVRNLHERYDQKKNVSMRFDLYTPQQKT